MGVIVTDSLPPLPEGFTLDAASPQNGAVPPLPPGFQLDSAPQAAQQPGFLDQLGRQLGLTSRYAMEGIGNALGVVADPINALTGAMPTGQAAGALADRLGLPKPQGKLEDTIAGASKALAGTGLTAGLGAAANIDALAAQPGLQALSSALGGGASEATKVAGGGAGAQATAGVLASLLPGGKALSSMGIRGLLRGTDPADMQDTMRAFEAAGTTPTVGQATQGGFARWLESTLAKAPGSAGVMAAKAKSQAAEIGDAMQGYADQLAPRTSPEVAGRVIQKGITGDNGFLDQFKQKTNDLYDVVDQHLPPDTAVGVPSTVATLYKLTKPVQGAEKVGALLTNPKVSAIADALNEDVRGAVVAGGQASLPYQALKDLRSKVGGMLADSSLVSDMPKGQLKQLYGALSEDMRNGLQNVSQDAYAANNRAENYYRAGLDRIDKIDSVVGANGGPEAVFKAATSGTREGATKLRAVMRSLEPDEANVVSSTVLRRLGRAVNSSQNDVGDKFSTETFLSNWAGMSPEAKSALFGRGGQQFADDMDKIAQVANNLREGGDIFRNPSGSAGALANYGAGATVATAALTGHIPAAVAALGVIGSSNLAARVMTNPTFVKWLARNTTAPMGVLPAQIAYLGNLGQKQKDPDLIAASQQLSAVLGGTQ